MLCLCSNGLTSKQLLEAAALYAPRDGHAALVVTADRAYRRQDRNVPRCTKELEALGLTAHCFDLDFSPAEQLLLFDAAMFIGGNPYELLDSLRRANARPVLERFARERLLIGWSAGALVFCPSLDLIDRYTPEMNSPKLDDLTALHLTDTQVLPHYAAFLRRFDRFEEKAAEYERETGRPVLRLSDGDGVFLSGTGEPLLVRGEHQKEG